MSANTACTVDANVFIAAARRIEPCYADSRSCLAAFRRLHTPIISPTFLLPEVAAAIVRRTGDPSLAAAVLAQIRFLGDLHLVALDEALALSAAQCASAHRLRGADAVYLAVAQQNNTTLITWDNEMLQRCPAIVPTFSPTDWLARRFE